MPENTPKNPLEDLPFSYRIFKNRTVSISFRAKEIKILTKQAAEKILSKIEGSTEMEAQMIMAKITGNFKRGNEREAKMKNR